jgi:hypothetical protein
MHLPRLDARRERLGLARVLRNQLRLQAHEPRDDAPRAHVGVAVLARDADAHPAHPVEREPRERRERSGEILLVDRHPERGDVPARLRAREDQAADRRVHEADLPRDEDAGPAGCEPAGPHHVDDHLRGLDEAARGMALEEPGLREDAHPGVRRVGRRQRVGAERGQDLGPVLGEELLAAADHVAGDERLRQRSGEELAHERRRERVRNEVRLDEGAQHAARRSGGVFRRLRDRLEDPGGERIGLGIRLRAARVEEGVVELPHAGFHRRCGRRG